MALLLWFAAGLSLATGALTLAVAIVAVIVNDCHRAGIRIIVISGDDGLTAAAIDREPGIVDEYPRIVTGHSSMR